MTVPQHSQGQAPHDSDNNSIQAQASTHHSTGRAGPEEKGEGGNGAASLSSHEKQLQYQFEVARQALQKVELEKKLIETALQEQSSVMEQQLQAIHKKVHSLSSENEFLRRQQESLAGHQQQIVAGTSHAGNAAPQAQLDVFRQKLNAREHAVQALEAQVQAEQQDRVLRNEEISLLLERISQLDGECATRQGDIAATDRLYHDVQSQESEIQGLQDTIASLNAKIASQDGYIQEQARQYEQKLAEARRVAEEEIGAAQVAEARAKRGSDERHMQWLDLEARLRRASEERAVLVESHERAVELLRADSERQIQAAKDAAAESKMAAQVLAEHDTKAALAAQAAQLREKHAQALHAAKAEADARLQDTIVSKDRALSNAISTLQESLKYAQQQKASEALDDIRARLQQESKARVEAIERDAEAATRREVAEVRAAAEQAQWEQRRKLLDEASETARAHQEELQALKNEHQAALSAALEKAAEAGRAQEAKLAEERAAHAEECRKLTVRYSEALAEQTRANANSMAGIAGQLMLTDKDAQSNPNGATEPRSNETVAMEPFPLRGSDQQRPGTPNTTSARSPSAQAAVARAQARLDELSDKLREREKLLQLAPPGTDVEELTIEVGLLQAQITRLQQVLQEHGGQPENADRTSPNQRNGGAAPELASAARPLHSGPDDSGWQPPSPSGTGPTRSSAGRIRARRRRHRNRRGCADGCAARRRRCWARTP